MDQRRTREDVGRRGRNERNRVARWSSWAVGEQAGLRLAVNTRASVLSCWQSPSSCPATVPTGSHLPLQLYIEADTPQMCSLLPVTMELPVQTARLPLQHEGVHGNTDGTEDTGINTRVPCIGIRVL